MTVGIHVATSTTLSLGEWAVSAEPDSLLACVGLGSCVAVAMYDPGTGTGGMAHMVLPDSSAARGGVGGAKFVDVAIPLLHATLIERGAVARRLRVYLAGGSQMLTSATPAGAVNIGQRNVEASHAELSKLGLRVSAEHLGGNRGRTVRLVVGSGRVTVTVPGESEVVL